MSILKRGTTIMSTNNIVKFDTVSHRVIHCLDFMYSEFIPINSNEVNEQSQKKLHGIMKQIIDKLYENPGLLNLSDDKDESFEWWQVNNMKPELDKVYQSIFKGLYEFYKFLYLSALHGEINGNCLSVSNVALKEVKANYKPQYKTLLREVGIDIDKGKSSIDILAENDILGALVLLAGKVPVNINKWTPFVLMNFACCLFVDDYDYLVAKTDAINNLDGLLVELQQRCLLNGYEQSIRRAMGASGFDFNIAFKNKIGGFLVNFSPRKNWPFAFGTINGIGQKAMIEDFDNLDKDLQKHFISICKICNGCLGCVKGGKNKIFTVNVNYDGKEYNLCPCFPKDTWESLDYELIDILFKYHKAQETYGTDWKKVSPK
ncbi:hypothetical protein LJB90_01005 [Eubacteriales bacterium OttesenSCG-928-G02]|nr:hypothetical protein [Eubacteriales bacterium OttesenSCG-928-G02]